MKNSLFCGVILFTCMSLTALAKDVGFPKDEPVLSMTAPEGWKIRREEDRLYLTTEDGSSVVVEVSALQATKKEASKALAEMKASVAEAFRNVEYDPMQEGGSNNVGLYILNGTGEDDDGKALLNVIMVSNGDTDQLFMVFIAATAEGSKEFGEDISAILGSIKKL